MSEARDIAADPMRPCLRTPVPLAEGLSADALRRHLLGQFDGSENVPATIRVADGTAHASYDPKTGGEGAGPHLENVAHRAAPPPSLPTGCDANALDFGDGLPEGMLGRLPPGSLDSFDGSGDGAVGVRPPDVGGHLFGFRLGHELGRGTFARVFLAEQTDLAGRPVVLKVSRIEGTEPQTLAQLQHTHIVPIYSVHEDAVSGLRALCMPYFGGASLSDVLKKLWRSPSHPGRGSELIEALDAVSAPGAETLRGRPGETTPTRGRPAASGQTPRAILAGLDFIRTAAWIVARLAEGLDHAHQRGVLHRDIKPSNVLIGADGEPMLLDFNLAYCESHPGGQGGLGGTIAYMAPEHLLALGKGRPSQTRQVDERSDIYSLGMVLYEMLARKSPFGRGASFLPLPVMLETMASERGRTLPTLRQHRPDAPWSLESILRRCLAPEPSARYQRAGELAEDLRCFLSDRPLLHAPELSLVERGQKWLRRHPRIASAAPVTAAACVLLLAAGLALVGVRQSLTTTRDRLAVSQAQDRQRAYEDGTLRALFLVNTTDAYRDHLEEGLRVCRDTLALYEVLDRDDWQRHPDWERIADADRGRLAEDTRELLLLLAGARVKAAPGDGATLADALALLDRAEGIPGLPPCRALWEDRAAYRRRAGDAAGAAAATAKAQAIEATTARDHYLLAMTRGREGAITDAVRHLDEALRLEPRHYWSWMQRGLCHQAQGENALAAGDFGTCVGLWPDFAWGYFNRATALTECGNKAAAIADYTRALARDPELTSAFFNRGMLHLELKEYEPALIDFRRARAQGREDAALRLGLGVALEGQRRHGEADEEFAAWAALADASPKDQRTRQHRAYGFAVATRLPERADAAFERVLRADPADSHALYGRAMLRDVGGRAGEALRYYNLALNAAPGLEEARRYRAVLLARNGQFEDARVDINICLSRERPAAGSLYAAACVAALQAAQAVSSDETEANTQEALRFLREAFARGYGVNTAPTDQDLDGVRELPAFHRLLEASGRAAKTP